MTSIRIDLARMTTTMLAASALTLMPAAQAKTVWRCGEGGRTYSETPCPGGRAVNAADPRSTAEVQAARDEIKRSQDQAARMQKDRLAEEKRNLAANARAAGMGPAKPATKPAEKLKPKSKKKAHRHPAGDSAEDDGTLRAAAAPSRRKKD